MKNIIKYSLRIIFWLLFSTIILILLLSVLIQLEPVKNKIARIAGDKISEVINGEFSIEEIQGDFFSELVLKNISLRQETDTVLFLSCIKAKYNLIPLLSGKVQVYYLGLENPGVLMKQHNDSTWNINQILKPSSKEKDTSKEGSINFNLDTLEIRNGDFEIISPDTLIPSRVQDINFTASFFLNEENISFILSRFSFFTSDPDLFVENISFAINKNEEFTKLSDLYIKTSQNRIDGRGGYLDSEPYTADVDLSTTPVETDEFEFFLRDLRIAANPVFRFNADLKSDSLNVNLGLKERNQEIQIYALSPNFRTLIDPNTEVLLDYKINAELNNIDLSTWVADTSLKYIISGTMNIDGTGVDPEIARINLEGRFNDCLIQGKPVDSIMLLVNMENGDMESMLKGIGDFGDFSLKSDIKDIFEKPKYKLELNTRNLNVAPLTGVDTLNSDLNINLQVNGQGFDPEKINVSTNLNVSTSYFQDLKLDNLTGRFQYDRKNLVVENMDLNLNKLQLNLSGNYNPAGRSDLNLSADFENLSGLDYYIPVSEINSKGKIYARIYGKKDSLNVDSKINFSDFNFEGNAAENMILSANAYISSNDTLANLELSVNNLNAGDFKIDSINAKVEGSPTEFLINTKINAGELNTEMNANISTGKISTSLDIDRWFINYKGEEWRLQQTPAEIEFDSATYRISNFYLAGIETDNSQSVKIDGILSRTGKENIQLELANWPIEQILKLTENEVDASGVIFIDASIKGPADSPKMGGNFRLMNAKFNENLFSKFTADFQYENELLNTKVSVIHRDSGFIQLSAGLPFSAAFDSMKFEPLKDDALSGSLEIQKFPLAILQTLDQIEELTGYLYGQVDIEGTLNSLNPAGDIYLKDARLKIPRYGVDYSQIAMKLRLAQDAAILDSILVRSKDGSLSGYGKMTFSSEIYKGDLSETLVTIEFDDFNPVNHPQFNMQLIGDIDIKGEEKNLVFNGDVTIPDAELFIPAIMNMMGEPTVPDLPQSILIREMQEDSINTEPESYAIEDTLRTDTTQFDYFEKIEGSMKVNIPRNVWIKNEDMYIEIMGNLELIKNPDFFEVFGSMSVVRGQYSLLGRTFVIDEGVITFQGGEELTPNLNVEASYTFRNTDRVEQTLKVFVTGDTEQPRVNFSLDGYTISEGEALSYIMFRKSMNELGMDQQDNVAEKAAANLISSQLTGYLSEKLDVDYIEVKADEGFENATVVVGKYITNDLFVSYEQRLGETDEQEISNYEVRLEYELFRFLLIELNNSSRESGFDLIFKKDFR